jgi:hypothetical protein
MRIRIFAGRATGLAALALVFGCWDAPVRESLELEVMGDGTARAVLTVELDAASRYAAETEAALRRRLERKARDLEDGSDPWLARFEVAGCPRQEGSWRRDDGELVEFRRAMHCETLAAAAEVLAGGALSVEVREVEGEVELSIVPLGGGTASRSERERALEGLERWTTDLERYLAAVFALAARAAERPELARDLWIAGFGDAAGKPSRALPGFEAELASDLDRATGEAASVLRARAGEAETADELARRAFDPLPARLTVSLPVVPLAVEGFARLGEGRFAAPEKSLYAAFVRLSGRWLAADPLIALVERGRAEGDEPIAVGPFVAGDPRRSEAPPTRLELREALLADLRSNEPLRLAWGATREAGPDEADGEGEEAEP